MAEVTDPLPDRRRAYVTSLARSACAGSLAHHQRNLFAAKASADHVWSVEAIDAVVIGSYVRMGGRVAAGSRR